MRGIGRGETPPPAPTPPMRIWHMPVSSNDVPTVHFRLEIILPVPPVPSRHPAGPPPQMAVFSSHRIVFPGRSIIHLKENRRGEYPHGGGTGRGPRPLPSPVPEGKVG